jgi:hypothetical protein
MLLISFCLSTALWAESPKELRKVTDEEIAKIKAAMPEKAVAKPAKPRKMLVFWRCETFFHTVIPVANEALKIMGEKTGAFQVTAVTDDYSVFTAETLKQFDVICLNNTTSLKFDPKATPERCQALMDFVKSGKGIVGIHAAADNFYQWPEGMEMMGNKFTAHPWGAGSTVAIKIDEPDHPLTAPFKGQGFKVKDEIYRTAPPTYSRANQFVLMSLDMSDPATRDMKGVIETDKDTGITWVRDVGKGRLFYCSLGHNDQIFMTTPILEHYLRGIQFAAGDFPVPTKPKAQASATSGTTKENSTAVPPGAKTYSNERLKLTFVVPNGIDLYTLDHPGPLASQLSSRSPLILVNPTFTEENVNVKVSEGVTDSDVTGFKKSLDQRTTMPLPEYKRVSVSLIKIGQGHKKEAVEHVFYMKGNILGKLRGITFCHNGRGFTFTCATSPERFDETNKNFFDALFDNMTFQ